jgi:hypothetical protein
MTPAQYATLKAAILADSTLAALPITDNGSSQIADAMNQIAVPDFVVWKTNVSITAVGDAINGGELSGLTTLNSTRLQTIALYSTNGVNPSIADRRQFFDDVFSGAGGALTRAKLLTLWKRLALRIEKVYAVGTGTDASPATLSFEGTITYRDVTTARQS